MSKKQLYVGVASQKAVKTYLLKVARGEIQPNKSLPKIWFESFNSFSHLLSDENQKLLQLIDKEQPQSFAELVSLSGRSQPSLSRTLKKMEAAGIIELKKGQGKALIPIVLFTCDQIHVKTYRTFDEMLKVNKANDSKYEPRNKRIYCTESPQMQHGV